MGMQPQPQPTSTLAQIEEQTRFAFMSAIMFESRRTGVHQLPTLLYTGHTGASAHDVMDQLFHETRIAQPALRFVWQHRVVNVRSRATWPDLLRAVAYAEHIPLTWLVWKVQQYLIARNLVYDTWRVVNSQGLSPLVYQITVDALPVIFPDGLQVRVNSKTPVLFSPHRMPVIMDGNFGCIQLNGVFTVRRNGRHSYKHVHRIDQSELWSWRKSFCAGIDLRRSIAAGGKAFILHQVGLKRFLAFGRQLTWCKLISAIAETGDTTAESLSVLIQRHLYRIRRWEQIWHVNSTDMITPSQIQYTVDALYWMFPHGLSFDVDKLPRIVFAPGKPHLRLPRRKKHEFGRRDPARGQRWGCLVFTIEVMRRKEEPLLRI